MRAFLRDMNIAKRSPATIEKRVALIERLRVYLGHRDPPVALLDAGTDALRDFQATFAHRQPATVDIYTRHMQAFFRWAAERELIERDPAAALSRPRVPKGRPHPMHMEELRILFAATTGPLRLVFALAVFAGLRRGEICALQRHDLYLDGPLATALIHGKGGKERLVPILRPLLDELYAHGLPRSGYVVRDRGRPYDPEKLSVDCHYHLKELGLDTTLHSGRHTFATYAGRITKDPQFVAWLLGHEQIDSALIYIEADVSDAHVKLAQMSTLAAELLGPSQPSGPLRAVQQ